MLSDFQKLADFLPEPLILVTMSGAIRAANDAFATRMDGSRAGVVGRSLGEVGLRASDDWADYLRRCARSRSFVLGAALHRGHGGVDVPYRCEGALYQPRTNGAEALVLLRLQVRDSSPSRFVALSQKIDELSAEISRRRRAELELREQRQLLQVTLTSIGDAVITTDTAGHVTFMNDVAERLTGWTRQDAMGLPLDRVFRILNEDSRQSVESPVARVLEQGQVVGLANHTLLLARDGTERPIDDSGAPIVDPSGRLYGVVLVFRDVTDLRLAERQEADARREAEAASRAKDEFLATLSHELRTPLNAILGWSRLLLAGLDPERQAHAVTVIERNAAMQARLIEDLLDVSRIMVGQLRLQREEVDLARIVDAALDAVRPAAESKRLRIESTVRPGSSVYGDAARLQQVIWNLLSNAVKFTPVSGRVSVDASDEGSALRIVVRDSGPGIPEAFRARMFDAFTQADGSLTRPHGGLGLGLAIVRRLVEAHDGQVEAESGGFEGRGATFTVTLPRAPLRQP